MHNFTIEPRAYAEPCGCGVPGHSCNGPFHVLLLNDITKPCFPIYPEGISTFHNPETIQSLPGVHALTIEERTGVIEEAVLFAFGIGFLLVAVAIIVRGR